MIEEHPLDTFDNAELEEQYRLDIQINRHQLEVASQNQATKFEKWYTYMEILAARIRDAEHDLEQLKSKVRLSIRMKTASRFKTIYKIDYPSRGLTDSLVSSLVETNPKVITEIKNINLLRLRHNKVKGAVDAARHRKSMIRVLSELYISSYWDKTTASGTKKTSGKRRRIDWDENE